MYLYVKEIAASANSIAVPVSKNTNFISKANLHTENKYSVFLLNFSFLLMSRINAVAGFEYEPFSL